MNTYARGIAKSFSHLSSLLLFSRGTAFSPSVFAFDFQERRHREKFELLLDEALYLVRVGIGGNTSTMSMDVP